MPTLARLRRDKALAPAALAKQVGVETKVLRNWEMGFALPYPEYMRQLCKILEVLPGQIIWPDIFVCPRCNVRMTGWRKVKNPGFGLPPVSKIRCCAQCGTLAAHPERFKGYLGRRKGGRTLLPARGTPVSGGLPSLGKRR
jgi:DNA-binding XRE family transcriptional regulator